MSKWVYILRSLHNPSHTYTGISTDLRRRLAEHNASKLPATRAFRPWRIENAVYFTDEAKANAFEPYLKSGSGRSWAQRHF